MDRYTTTTNNNEYLERLNRTGPKRLHVLCKYILSKFNAYNKNAGIRDCGQPFPAVQREGVGGEGEQRWKVCLCVSKPEQGVTA